MGEENKDEEKNKNTMGDRGQGGEKPAGENPGGSGFGGSQKEPPEDWRANLIPEDIREDPAFADFKSPQDVMRSYLNAQKLIGKDKLVRPDENSPKEVWEEFYKVAGRPENAEDYSLPEDMGEDAKKLFDEEALKSFKELAHENGVPKSAFEKMLGKYAEYIEGVQSQQSESMNQRITEGLQALEKEVGREKYENMLSTANAGLEAIGDESLSELILGNEELRNHPGMIKLFSMIGESSGEHGPLKLPGGASPRVDSVTQARQQLDKFETEHADVLNAVNYNGPKNRDHILQQRFKLLQKAYPEQNPAGSGSPGRIEQNKGFTEINVSI